MNILLNIVYSDWLSERVTGIVSESTEAGSTCSFAESTVSQRYMEDPSWSVASGLYSGFCLYTKALRVSELFSILCCRKQKYPG